MSLGLPSWGQLIEEIARELGYDPRVFRGYGDFLELAEYYKLQTRSIGPLRSLMDRIWHGDEDRVDKSPIHQAIVDLDFPIIYTTNYDRWLEIAYKRRDRKFVKIANVGDFTKIQDKATQIVKFHGDFDDDQSLVLTESSYFERLTFESPLDIKLRADTIGKSVLFIGYSLSDINIRYLVYKLYRLWADSPYASARPKSYIFLSRPNPVQERILSDRGITPIISESDVPETGLYDFLDKLLRQSGGAAV